MKSNVSLNKIGVIGLGYVGLPLARLFATQYAVVGYDISRKRVKELQAGIDATLEIKESQLHEVLKGENNSLEGLFLTNQKEMLQDCNVFIVTVPTPVDKNNKPVLIPLKQSSKTVGGYLKKGDVVIYESTVYPGATEEICVPILENESGLVFNIDFTVGYSPERINPGDKKYTVDKILKVTSGSTTETAAKIDHLYASVISAGTHLAPSIKVAEAAKVIENSQRDINIAFVNELAKIFNRLDIDTHAVLEAAATKWNFLPFKPGLVGGHCIGVDPYYLAQKAQEVGYHPEIILAGRRLNDSMGAYVASEVMKLMLKKEIKVQNAKVLVLGITFKENCPDVRNSKVIDVIAELKDFGLDVYCFDPHANPEAVKKEYNIELLTSLSKQTYDAAVLAVAHNEFNELNWTALLNAESVLYDVKGILPFKVDGRL